MQWKLPWCENSELDFIISSFFIKAIVPVQNISIKCCSIDLSFCTTQSSTSQQCVVMTADQSITYPLFLILSRLKKGLFMLLVVDSLIFAS